MSPSPVIEPWPHWWEVSVLIAAPFLLPERRERSACPPFLSLILAWEPVYRLLITLLTKTIFAHIFRYTWIGLNDLKNESDFQWSDGANSTYKSMSPQMDYIKDERAEQEMDCIASDQNGQWTNFHCDDKFYSLCKKKLSKCMTVLIRSV